MLKNKLSIEVQAKIEDKIIESSFDYKKIEFAIKNKYAFKYSKNAGTSFCNYLYFNILKNIIEKKLDTKAVFIHVPQIHNISDFPTIVHVLKQIINLKY